MDWLHQHSFNPANTADTRRKWSHVVGPSYALRQDSHAERRILGVRMNDSTRQVHETLLLGTLPRYIRYTQSRDV